jgi:hypothetical protein
MQTQIDPQLKKSLEAARQELVDAQSLLGAGNQHISARLSTAISNLDTALGKEQATGQGQTSTGRGD